MTPQDTLLRPPALRPGDTVRLVTPSGPPTPEKTAAGIALFESWGLTVQVAPGLYDRLGYLAGDDDSRVTELNDALRDDTVRGIFCARGGYGMSRIVDRVDFAAARRDPKPVVGYSDITALHSALYVHGVASVAGPVVTTFANDHDTETAEALRRALMTTDPVTVRAIDGEPTIALTSGEGTVTGPLLGGNLSLIVDAIGTGTLPDYTDAILFMEEVNEEPYRADRILTQLLRSGVFDGVAGLALGQFTGCEDDDWDWDILDVLRDRLEPLNIPILGGLPIGHGDNPRTVPFGPTATFDLTTKTLTATPAVS
ncbi:S66 peptidase family protein [Stackebrandtia soli]|uniref:S66 peptidase family protein n=1 Tax=Stackebrandtia soli TaxID=1892856 RepID=UPI0039EA6DA1